MSIMSMSLEKRLVIRPMGVVSKKCNGDRRMLVNMPTCSLLAASTRPDAKAKAAHMILRPERNIEMEFEVVHILAEYI